MVVVPIVAGVATTAVNLSLIHGGKIRGTITDQQNGAAIAGIAVAAYDGSGNVISSGVSAGDGKYALVAPAGDYRLAAFDGQLRYTTAYSGGAANFETASWSSVATDATNDLNFTLVRGLRLSGKVIDATNVFLSVSNVQVGALDASGNRVAAATAVDGSFNLVLAPGTYKILVTDPLDRYHASFYNGALTLAAATPVVVNANGPSPITIFLSRLIRRRAAPHA
ncbi:MAG TPA: carboxypeptidase regulatory-like domain-containing protein [Thermoanaerobaculia bacterium]|nr:carboxypeptidase regulatory-like domain-containing protein [Thermoanaerobaculia bacterium]